jgi:inorganic pyrophosphatase
MLGRSSRLVAAAIPRVVTPMQWRAAVSSATFRRAASLSQPFHPSVSSLCSMRRLFSNTTTFEVDKQPSMEWRMFFRGENNSRISPWHDIRMKNSDGNYNYVNEIARGARAKMEVTLKEDGNPIKQDVKKGKLRFFTYGDLPFNYGCIPQTWENPHEKHPDTGLKGDGDPVDVVEISQTPLPLGSVSSVKVLGIMALIDEEETDWKVLAIARGNPLYDQINNEADIERLLPGLISKIRDWFQMYKTTDGKPQNQYAFGGAVKVAFSRIIIIIIIFFIDIIILISTLFIYYYIIQIDFSFVVYIYIYIYICMCVCVCFQDTKYAAKILDECHHSYVVV